MISKKLLSEVLEIGFIGNVEVVGNTVYISSTDGTEVLSINVDKLVRECKEWVLQQKNVWRFQVTFHNENTELQHLIGKIVVHINEEGNDFIADTELEALFKAVNSY